MSISIAELRDKMVNEARRKAEEIIEDAKKKAEEIISRAEEEWARRSREKREEIVNNAKNRARIILSEARRKARLIIAGKKRAIIEEIFGEAWKRIERREGIDIEESLRRLLEESMQYIEEPKKIYVNKIDVDIIERILAEKNLQVDVEETEEFIGGLVLISTRGEKVDNTYETRFERAKTVLASEIARILWG